MIKKLLIANRGDGACRIARTARALGIAVATVHSSTDRNAAHVRQIGQSIEVGGGPASESYLNIPAIIAAAQTAGADAVHPGIGFLSETPDFANAVEDAGLIFVGPTADTLARFGDKLQAKREAAELGIPVIPGGDLASDDQAGIAAMTAAMQPPLLLKAAAGGGGRGIRVVGTEDDLGENIASAMREAKAAFGRADLLVEQYLDRPRHVEVQLAGDGTGAVMHLYDRECSLQRRHQKVVEEAPVAGLAAGLRQNILDAACRLGAQAKLRGLATAEFLVAGDEFFFLEVNPRLQVEHPVTEAVTGLDLVAWQLRIAAGDGLPLTQDQIPVHGHAMQARLYAEDPASGFAPATGVVRRIDLPASPVRSDMGIEAGEEIGPFYDCMLGKIICHGEDRAAALGQLRAALADAAVFGVPTNLAFLGDLLARPEVADGTADTALIDREIASDQSDGRPADELFALAGALAMLQYRSGAESDPWQSQGGFTNWRLGQSRRRPSHIASLQVAFGEDSADVAFSPCDEDGGMSVRVDQALVELALQPLDDGAYSVAIGNEVQTVRAVCDDSTVHLHGAFGALSARVSLYADGWQANAAAVEGRVLAPVMGNVTKVLAKAGERVSAGDVLVVQESMKMEIRLTAPCDGVVATLACAEGDMVARHAFIAEVRPDTT
jgi:3-methylcrotonyl-CoA carboxylase alpha subunit